MGVAVESVGIRELKSGLSGYLKRVRAGARVTVTERGRAIAVISPIDGPADVDWARALVASGRAEWSGGKPAGASQATAGAKGQSVSAAVIEDRR